jgi:hypothetical protein
MPAPWLTLRQLAHSARATFHARRHMNAHLRAHPLASRPCSSRHEVGVGPVTSPEPR